MLKKVLIFIILINFGFSLLFISQKVKDYRLRKAMIGKAISIRGEVYPISDKVKRISNNIINKLYKEKSLNSYKLVYEMDVDCFACLEKLKKIMDFALKVKDIKEILVAIITTEKSLSYIEFRIAQAIPYYDIWIVQQEFRKDDFNIYLLDDNNKIIIAGDFIEYPFLEQQYIKCLLKP